MWVSDRPTRYFAAFVVAPLLVWAGVSVFDSPQPVVSVGLCVFAAVLFSYELFWITRDSAEVWYSGGAAEREAVELDSV